MARKKPPKPDTAAPSTSEALCPEALRGLLVPLDDVHEHPHNVKIGHNVKAIARALEEHGWHAPIVANRRGDILVGNGRWLAARRLGLDRVPVLTVDDDDRQAVRRMFSDNRSGEFSMWDVEEVKLFLPDLSGMEDIYVIDDIVPLDLGPPPSDDPPPPDREVSFTAGGKSSAPSDGLWEVSAEPEAVEKVKAALAKLSKVRGVVVRSL